MAAFLAVWSLLLVGIGVACSLGHVSGRSAVVFGSWLIPMILGTTGIVFIAERRGALWPKRLIVIALLMVTPVYHLWVFPMTFLWLAVSLAVWPGHSASHPILETPIRAACDLSIIFMATIAAAALLAEFVSQLARWSFWRCGERLNWLLAFPIYLAAWVAFDVCVSLILMVLSALGLYPDIVWTMW